MNKPQTILTWSALAMLGLSLLFAPWAVVYRVSPILTSIEHHPIFLPPDGGSLSGTMLFFEWVALGVAYYAIYGLLKNKT